MNPRGQTVGSFYARWTVQEEECDWSLVGVSGGGRWTVDRTGVGDGVKVLV